MAEKSAKKPKPKGAKDDDSGVLASLSSTRSTRLSRRARDGAPAAPRKAGPAAAKAKAKAAAKPSAETAGNASGETAAATTRATPTAAKAESAAASAKPARKKRGEKASASTAKAAAPKAAPDSEPIPLAAAGKPRPRPVRAGSPALEDSSEKAAAQRADDPGQSGIDLVKTVVQAAGEVAQIGATVSGQIIKRAVDKLPKRP